MLKIGSTSAVETTVEAHNTAVAVGSGDMEVLATPAMVALMENAAMRAVADSLPAGSATVGVSVNVSHIKASPVGAVIRATAELISIEGRRLTFRVAASDEAGPIGEGMHVRCIVDREKFLARIS